MKVLGVHPGPLMYTKIFLRLEPLGLELVAAAARAGRSRGRADRPAGREPPRLLPPGRARGGRTSSRFRATTSPTSRRSSTSPRRRRRGCRAATICVGGHSASFVADAMHRAWRRRDRLRDPRRGRGGGAAAARGDRGRRRSRRGAGRGHRDGRGAAARLCPFARRSAAGARPAAPPPQILPRRARPVRLDRVLARLPVGLLVLQRLDLLRPLATAWSARSGSSRICARSASRASSSSTMSPSSRSGTAWSWARRSPAPASRSATTSKPAATCCCATRRCSASGRSSASPTCSSGSRRSTRRACTNTASACRSAAISRRSNSPARSASISRST